ncbi:hypothetical protein GOODEAATRI_029656 [Goodea atripinnis]|uniref:Uncharacterized protein n=1 Tax=Goodea atripinnis TaxID=208336 RepID=A0ABV0NYY2_9TELE
MFGCCFYASGSCQRPVQDFIHMSAALLFFTPLPSRRFPDRNRKLYFLLVHLFRNENTGNRRCRPEMTYKFQEINLVTFSSTDVITFVIKYQKLFSTSPVAGAKDQKML